MSLLIISCRPLPRWPVSSSTRSGGWSSQSCIISAPSSARLRPKTLTNGPCLPCFTCEIAEFQGEDVPRLMDRSPAVMHLGHLATPLRPEVVEEIYPTYEPSQGFERASTRPFGKENPSNAIDSQLKTTASTLPGLERSSAAAASPALDAGSGARSP